MIAICCSSVKAHNSSDTWASSLLRSMKMVSSSCVLATCFTRAMTTPEGFLTPRMFSSSVMTFCRCHRLSRAKTSPTHQSNEYSSMKPWMSLGTLLAPALTTETGGRLRLRSRAPASPPAMPVRLLTSVDSRLAVLALLFCWLGTWCGNEGGPPVGRYVGADMWGPCAMPNRSFFSTSVMRRMQTPEGLLAFWIFNVDSMTFSCCSGVRVLRRSTTPSARPFS
mmetsp:Transcript_23623/g.73582  ORF Transcript_23623/g.73582 Transcript_23623/m.73582 type:complete len:223 (-) Transcript_23623:236-904(-)